MTDPIIKYLQATYDWMAAYTGASQHMIHSFRVGRRTLAVDQLLALQKIIDALELDTPVEELASFPTLTAYDPEQVAALVTDLEKKRSRLQERLEAARKKRDVLVRGLHACQKLLQNDVINLQRQKFVRFRESDLNNQLQKALQKLLKLETDLQGVEAQLGYLSKLPL
ncbi:MAG: hypothetical protein WBG46_07990 [Nonlabens sp.]